MSTDGFQITIPDLDDGDDYAPTPTQFGRSNVAFGGFDSPTPSSAFGGGGGSTDRTYFHARDDSRASIDSSISSFKFTTPQQRNGSASTVALTSIHTSNSSVTTNHFPLPSRKSSFASLRNAFKSGKTADVDAPPVPMIDPQAYPALRNPFQRSEAAVTKPGQHHHGRKASLGKMENHAKGASTANRSVFGRQISQSGAGTGAFFLGNNGSDASLALPGTPPVPRIPGSVLRHKISSSLAASDGAHEYNTPAVHALHVVFGRFVDAAERMLDVVLGQTLEDEPYLPAFLGPGVNPTFDGLLESLGRIAQRHTNGVISCVTEWRASSNEPVPAHIIRRYLSGSNTLGGRIPTPSSVARLLNERKSLAAIYITCRALIVVLQTVQKNVLDEFMGNRLEESTFEQFKRPNLKMLSISANHRANADLYATLLGQLANVRFQSVTDRFLKELKPLREGAKITKEEESRLESMLQGLKHVQLKVWPPEAFEEAAEFMMDFSQAFTSAHGQRLKTAFAETLIHLMHPVGKTAKDELNHPVWAKAIETIYPKARDMMSKPRYWSAAYPLVVTTICMSPNNFFLRNWLSIFDAGIARIKERGSKVFIMNGTLRLAWTYLFRCKEVSTTSTGKMDLVLKPFFPVSRITIYPYDEPLDPFCILVHFLMCRHHEHGRDFALKLLQESSVMSATGSVNPGELLAPERMIIAIRAVLLTLESMKKDAAPAWPTSANFSKYDFQSDYVHSAEFLPDAFYAKPDMQDFYDRYGPILSRLANICGMAVGSMFIFERKYSAEVAFTNTEDKESLTMRRHGEITVVFRRELAPQIDLLRTIFESWPRCLHPSIPLADTLDYLYRGVIHVDPAMGVEASNALKRVAEDVKYSKAVLSRFTRFLFSAESVTKEGTGVELLLEQPALLILWETMVNSWFQKLLDPIADELPSPSEPEVFLEMNIHITVQAVLEDIEAGALFLLTHGMRRLRVVGLRTLRMLSKSVKQMSRDPDSHPEVLRATIDAISWIGDIVQGRDSVLALLEDEDHLLDREVRARLKFWRENRPLEWVQRLAETEDETDRGIWTFLLPKLIRAGLLKQPGVIAVFRETLASAVMRYHQKITNLAGISGKGGSLATPVNRSPAQTPKSQAPKDYAYGRPSYSGARPVVVQWQTWLAILCATTVNHDTRNQFTPGHSRAVSEATQRMRLTDAAGLFRHIIPFLASEHGLFRTAAVTALGCIHQSVFNTLLTTLQSITRHIYDEARSKVPAARPSFSRTRDQERLHTAVAQVYQLTAHFVKDPRSLDGQSALKQLLQFVRETTTYLCNPAVRNDWEQQRLRRYFCGVVEHLFDGLSTLQDSDRFLQPNMRLSLYRLCEEWCAYGPLSDSVRQRLDIMSVAAPAAWTDAKDKSEATHLFQTETTLLSAAAAGAMASLCQGAFFSAEVELASPTSERIEILSVLGTLERIAAMLGSPSNTVNASGRKALRSLLVCPTRRDDLIDACLQWSYVTSTEPDSSRARFFEVVADVILTMKDHHFSFGQVACLALSNLCQVLEGTRRLAFNLLESLHADSDGQVSIAPFESAISSRAASVYLPAQRRISEIMYAEHGHMAGPILSECALRMPQVYDAIPTLHAIHPHILHWLEPWLGSIHLMHSSDSGAIASDGQRALYNLISFTVRYGDLYPDQIQALWAKLVSDPSKDNARTTVKFLVEQAARRGNPTFFTSARRIVACLSRTPIGRRIFIDLIDLIDPAGMLPAAEKNPSVVSLTQMDLSEEVDQLLTPPQEPKQRLGTGQLALLVMSDIALEGAWELGAQLPVLLHAILVHVDHQSLYMQALARNLLFQTLRSWTPGFDDLPVQSLLPSRPEVKAVIDALVEEGRSLYWTEDEPDVQVGPKMDRLCREILSLLVPLYPQLRQSWGELALAWGCDCAIRGIAFRSLQLFRALMPKINRLQLANMIGRISGTVSSATDESLQSFTREVLITYTGLAKSNLDPDLLPPLFWCACACLSTTVEQEFLTVLQLLEVLLTKLDLDDAKTVDALISYRPTNWTGPDPTLQPLIMQGLRSSSACDLSLTLLGRLAKIDDAELIDPSGGRVREIFTVLLPWCLNKMDGGSTDVDITALAVDLAQLAELEGRHSISKLMKSFSKGIIRTRDDLLRQGVSCIREHFASQDPTVPVTLLLGLVLNSRKWIQVKSMEILKTLFQNPLSRTPIARSELLDPLLRLLTTDLAPQALEVLDEPLTITPGPNPAQGHALVSPSGQGAKTVFGVPTESGWAVPMPEERIHMCRSNILAVYDTCKPNNRPSMVTFEPETRNRLATQSFFPVQNPTSLGDLVSTLNDLNNFFQKDDVYPRPNNATGLERADSKRRVAEIVSRSLGRSPMRQAISSEWISSQLFRDSVAETIPDGGNAPFIGLFSVSNSAETTSLTPSTSIEVMNNNFLRDPDGGESDSFEEHANMHGNGTFYRTLDRGTHQQQYPRQLYSYNGRGGADDDEYTVRVPLTNGSDGVNGANGTNGRDDYDSESDSDTDSFALDRLVGRLVRKKSSTKARSKSRGPTSMATPHEDITPVSISQRYERRR